MRVLQNGSLLRQTARQHHARLNIMSAHRIHWDHYFVQWCLHWLPELGLQAEGKPQFSQLPLEADILVIQANQEGSWKIDPIWRYVSPYNIVEFKSVQDPFQNSDWGKLMAYVGLTIERQNLEPETEIAGWLIVPYINRSLRKWLNLHQLKLSSPVQGFHISHTGIFPLNIVEFNHLPLEQAFVEFKTFMKKGPILLQVMQMALQKWEKSRTLQREYTTIISSIHTQEAQTVIEVLKQDKPKLKRMAALILSELGDEVNSLESIQENQLKAKLEGKLEGKLETAQHMLAKGLDEGLILELTGLTKPQLSKLKKSL